MTADKKSRYPEPMTSNFDLTAVSKTRGGCARADFVEDGMKLGLGTGSTADLFRGAAGGTHARRLEDYRPRRPPNAPPIERARSASSMHELDALGSLDLVIDGADEADSNLDLIKGGGGALLREKIVAASAGRMVVIADESKLVAAAGGISRAGGSRRLRPSHHAGADLRGGRKSGLREFAPLLRVKSGKTFRTDSGNVIYDCPFGAIADVPALAAALSPVTGVVEHGLFVNMASDSSSRARAGRGVIERLAS